MSEKEKSPVKASISVPIKEQPVFDTNRELLMQELATLGRKMSFSNFVRLVISGWNLDKRDDGLYLTVKL